MDPVLQENQRRKLKPRQSPSCITPYLGWVTVGCTNWAPATNKQAAAKRDNNEEENKTT